MLDDNPAEPPGRATTIALIAPDLNGNLRTRHIPVDSFDRRSTPNFSDIIFALDDVDQLIPRPEGFAGWWPSWAGGFGDLLTSADLPTRRSITWRPGYDVVFADLHHRDGTPVAVAPRQLLRRLCGDVSAVGVVTRVGIEVEFFLHDAGTRTNSGSDAAAYSFSPPLQHEATLTDVVASLAASGIGVGSWYGEGGSDQYEIALAPVDPLTAADQTVLTRSAIARVAAHHGLRADFRPSAGNGFSNGLHAHISLYDKAGANLVELLRTSPTPSLSGSALAGVLEILKPATALMTPTPTGYARLAPHGAAGTTATWAEDNRSAGVRYLNRGPDSRFEIRTAAGDANPYLMLAAVLAGVTQGIAGATVPPPQGQSDLYTNSPAELLLPTNLADAVAEMRGSSALSEALGTDFINFYAATRLWLLPT